MAIRPLVRSVCALGVLACLSSPVRADDYSRPVVDPKGEWAPVRVGEEALFKLVSKREALQGPSVRVSEVWEGTQHVAVRQGSEARVEVAVTARLRHRGQADEVKREAMILAPRGGAYHVTALRTAITGAPKEVQLETPVPLLPEVVEKGATWESAHYEMEGVRYREEAEILGVQDAKTPAGLFKGCLVIRHVGTLEGEFDAENGMRVRLKRGKVERTQWLARGVGTVMFKEEFSSTLVVPSGKRVATRVTRQAAIRGVRQRPANAR